MGEVRYKKGEFRLGEFHTRVQDHSYIQTAAPVMLWDLKLFKATQIQWLTEMSTHLEQLHIFARHS